MNASGFTSALVPELDAYLAFKEKMGFCGSSRIWYLGRFDAYCTAHERAVLDRDTVEGWVSEQLTRSGRYRSWMSYIRDVGRWLQAHGQRDAYVLSDRRKAQVVPAHPYLLSRHEIEVFFAAAATLNAGSHGYRFAARHQTARPPSPQATYAASNYPSQAGRGPDSRSQEAKLHLVATIYREAVRRGEPPWWRSPNTSAPPRQPGQGQRRSGPLGTFE
jgi:hypothetical protein